MITIPRNKAERIYACRKSILLFSLIYFTDFHHFPMPKFHKDMYNDLSFKDWNIVEWIMFRESAKTSLAKIKIIHDIVYEKKHFILWTSFDEKKAKGNLYDIALQLQTNKNLIADFGQLFYEEQLEIKKTRKKSIDEFVTSNDIKVKAYSTGQSPRGEVFGPYRPDFIILDDIETAKTIISEPRTKQVIDFIDELMSGAAGSADILVLGNRLTNDGSINYFERKIKGDEEALIRDVPIFDKNGNITWSGKYVKTDKEAIEYNKNIKDKLKYTISLETKKRRLGETVFNREMMNQPLSDKDREIKWKWLQHTFTEDEVKLRVKNRYVMIDVADSKERKERKNKGQPDYTGTIVFDWDFENNWFIEYAKRNRFNAPELIDWIFYIWETYKPLKIGIEKKAFLDQIKPYIDIKSQETQVYPVVVELEHGGRRKEDRIRGALQGRLQAGKIQFKRNTIDDTDELKKELYDFPRAEFDDLSDALAYGEQVGMRPYVQGDSGIMTEVNQEFYENKKKNESNLKDLLRNI